MIFSTKFRKIWLYSLLSSFLLPCVFGETALITPEPVRKESKASKMWKWSVAALLAGSAVDAASSWGKLEANPALRGPGARFSGRSVLIKSSLVGGVLASQMLFNKKGQSMKAATWTNFVLAGALGGAAAYNMGNNSAKNLPSYLQPR